MANNIVPMKLPSGLAGRPPRNARVFLDRQRPILAARWVRASRRALAYLNNPATPIDANWIKLFDTLGDRLGCERRTSQTVTSDSTSVAATVVTGEDVLLSLKRRATALEQHYGRPFVELLTDGEVNVE